MTVYHLGVGLVLVGCGGAGVLVFVLFATEWYR